MIAMMGLTRNYLETHNVNFVTADCFASWLESLKPNIGDGFSWFLKIFQSHAMLVFCIFYVY